MKLSLAGWSLQKLFRSVQDPLRLVDYPAFVRQKFSLDAVELNSPFFPTRDSKYLKQIVDASQKAKVRLVNIAVDEKGDLASEDESVRQDGLRACRAWIPIARELGCNAIRCNSGGTRIHDRQRAIMQCIDSFRALADEGQKQGIAILIENHGGISSDANTIVHIIETLRRTHGPEAIGTLPDFGNWPESADLYASLSKIMPFAKAVHAKVNDIDANLNHPRFDHSRCIRIVREAGYNGYLGIEFEGAGDPVEGVRRSIRKLTPLMA